MANLLSSVTIADNNVPKKYVAPPEKRPVIARKIKLPIIDLQDKENSINNIMIAAREFGLFEVINHGISRDLMNGAMEKFEEVFKMSPEEKSKINLEEDIDRVCRLYPSSYNYSCEDYHYWRDVLRHLCTPFDKYIKYWPQKPNNYREIVKPYVQALKDLSFRIVEDISEGLGLEKGSLTSSELVAEDVLTINHYPPCPDPSLTMGLPSHVDPTIINIVQAAPVDVPGLQLLKNGQWFELDSTPDALLIFVGNQLEVISNGQLKAPVHRAVTNSEKVRTTAVYFVNPSMECIVEPAKLLVEAENDGRPFYKTYKFKDYFKAHVGHQGDRDNILELYDFKINY